MLLLNVMSFIVLRRIFIIDFAIENGEKILDEWIHFVYKKAAENFKCKNKTRAVLECDVIKPNTRSRLRKKNKVIF